MFKLTSVVDWRVVTDRNQKQVNIDNSHKNTKQVRHDYAISGIVYVEKTDVYQKLDYKKHGLYIIT